MSGSEKFRQVQRPRILKASVLGPGDAGMSKASTFLWLQAVLCWSHCCDTQCDILLDTGLAFGGI